jgi:hypothetical protein
MTSTANKGRDSSTQDAAPRDTSTDALVSRWRAATHPQGVFWPQQTRWHRVTSAPGAAGSSGTPQDLRPC